MLIGIDMMSLVFGQYGTMFKKEFTTLNDCYEEYMQRGLVTALKRGFMI